MKYRMLIGFSASLLLSGCANWGQNNGHAWFNGSNSFWGVESVQHGDENMARQYRTPRKYYITETDQQKYEHLHGQIQQHQQKMKGGSVDTTMPNSSGQTTPATTPVPTTSPTTPAPTTTTPLSDGMTGN